MCYSDDGSLFAWCNGQTVSIVNTEDFQVVRTLDKPKTAGIRISPQNNLIATWEPYAVNKNDPAASTNLNIWDIKTGECLRSLAQKRFDNWAPQWSSDEVLCARNVTNEVHFFENNDFSNIVKKLYLPKVAEFRMSSTPSPCHVAAYVPGTKGQPSFVRIYKYPVFGGPTAALANKSFFKADKADMYWNKKGTALVVHTATETSAGSYYGDTGLHFLGVNGESSLVPLGKEGPVYSVEWSPNAMEFCVVYGYMPAKATIYNCKCEPVFDFGTGKRNLVYYNPQGSIVCLAGFGNLRGNMEFWAIKQKKLIRQTLADDTTYFQWCPDGEHIVTATTAPRLRVGNMYKVWHYSGILLHQQAMKQNEELWEVLWQPFPEGVFPEKPISFKAVESTIEQPDSKKVAAYRPPGARGTASTIKLHEDFEPPSNMKQTTSPENMSKSALKNKKKREAKARAKQDQQNQEPPSPTDTSQPAQAEVMSTGDPEKDKRIKNLRKKLQQIEKLKEQQKSGKQLEVNQLEKIKTEEALLQEIEQLQL